MDGLIHEKGMCKILSAVYKAGGYEVVPTVEATPPGYKMNLIVINGRSWAVKCPVRDLPKAVSVQVTGDVGYLPMEPVAVRKGYENQSLLTEVAEQRGLLPGGSEDLVEMKKIPVIYRDRWQLYQDENGEVYGFDVELLKIIDFKTVEESEDFQTLMATSGRLGMFNWQDFTVYIAPARFYAEDLEKIRHIAKLDWENQQEDREAVENLTLFDGEKTIVPPEPEE